MLTKVAMRAYSVYLVVALLVLVSCSAIPKPGEENHKDHKDRVIDKTLSDAAHEIDDEHNADYDHEAFLGKDDARTFDDLSPEESKERLGIIVDKIDKDKNGEITEIELKEWIQYVQRRYVTKDADRVWSDHDVTGDILTWESYKKRTYGTLADEDLKENDEAAVGLESTKKMLERDIRRWKAADVNGDNKLDKQEFIHFQHPEDGVHMKDIVVEETLEDIDTDKDGFISLEEYISDVYDEDDEDDEDEEAPHDGEPDWVTSERNQFKNYRDKNGDGKLDREEVKEWIIPEDFDHSETEAQHLVRTADGNGDGKLSKLEILDHYKVFVGSQATDFGEALTRHDEF